MIGTIHNNRRGISKIHPSQFLIKVDDAKYNTSAAVAPLFGKKVVYKTISGKTITGKITGSHGNKGVVKVSFERLLPGTAVGEKIEIK
ncbi:MAG: 50S ribosomal protein L35ae [archaeon]